ncbi:hypothetical protein ACFP9V_22875 [Deinococcus radiopugnans]|uniref:Uncharacterized protein n=1 Tax=Deinococcus radiopugnans ATCC 19172 TaxID=585398 RepID=A0A5C4Y6J8_9DEIO|nr:hypothetical protein [Deinococcus radiopugnans]MBB6017100.1 hypothetical protein [Deinococcus radiopugnans ATCC 19172]TNM70670.1 hypothetical protein FHR04_12265 [Deinococcus radiopugnans ATCC 19172]
MNNVLVLTTVLALATLAFAQQGGQTLSAEQRARMTQMQPANDLAQDIRLLPGLEKNKATAVTKAQARSLLSILTTLQKATSIQPNDAKKYLTQIEDKILTDTQLTALDALVIKDEKEREAQRAQRQATGQNSAGVLLPGNLGGLGGGAASGRNTVNAGAQGSQFDPSKFNPFKDGRGADALKTYIAALQKK